LPSRPGSASRLAPVAGLRQQRIDLGPLRAAGPLLVLGEPARCGRVAGPGRVGRGLPMLESLVDEQARLQWSALQDLGPRRRIRFEPVDRLLASADLARLGDIRPGGRPAGDPGWVTRRLRSAQPRGTRRPNWGDEPDRRDGSDGARPPPSFASPSRRSRITTHSRRGLSTAGPAIGGCLRT
jgi:hypothetical protein